MRLLVMPSPAGPLTVGAEGGALALVAFGAAPSAPRRPAEGAAPEDTALLTRACRQLEEYFAGERRAFDLPLRLAGTPFQRRCWEALQRIPYGETRTYGQLARELGSPGAARAVGGALHRNPIAIVVPCHRVVGADGALTGFAGGLEAKRLLLEMERTH